MEMKDMGEKNGKGAAFDYSKAVAELEKIAEKAEDPATGIDDIDKYIGRANGLIAECRRYLRTARDRAEAIETE